MPTTNSQVSFRQGTAVQFANLATKDANTLYFCTDTRQIFIGEYEYTKSVVVLGASPTAETAGDDGRLYTYNGNLYLCKHNSDNTYNWIRVANVNDKKGTVISVGAGDGLTTTAESDNPITSIGTIVHAVPDGASVHTDAGADQAPNFGESFNVETVETDKFGHVTGIKTHTITLPAVSGGTTYTIAPGSTEGTIKVTPSEGSAYEVAVTGWNDLAKKSDLTTLFRYKGTVATVGDLPNTGAEEGDVYHVTADACEYVYAIIDDAEGPSWESLGGLIDLSAYAKTSEVVPRVEGVNGQVAKFNEDGTVSSTGHTLEASVPANAKFTDTVYEHPGHTAYASGLYKLVIDEYGHVTGAEPATTADITALNIPCIADNVIQGTAAQAAADGSGNNIEDTYATKNDVKNAALTWQEF